MIEHKVDMYRFGYELDNLKRKSIPDNPTLFYGSSTFAMWKDIEVLFSQYNAVNFGFGGSTSDEALFHYETLAKPTCPKYMVWYFGDNEPVCGYTVKETTTLFKQVWDNFTRDFPQIKIITIATKTSPARNEYADFVKQLNAWQKQYAESSDNVFYVDRADICQKDGQYLLENYLPDQLHFGEKGYKILFERVNNLLKKF